MVHVQLLAVKRHVSMQLHPKWKEKCYRKVFASDCETPEETECMCMEVAIH